MAENKKMVEAITSMEEDFGKWYTDVVKKADLIDYSSVKGCMIIRPYGYAIWELLQKQMDDRFKATGHENIYMPLFIPESLLQKEKDHVEGFAPEVAWVTHGGSEPLQERLCVRPTSETLFCEHYANVVQSYRDLPKLYNQWCNVVRWEKTTRPFLRSREFLWQEGHTVHATAEEAIEETERMLNLYADFCKDVLNMPVVKGRKTDSDKFAGAEATYAIEALMHDGKALQAGTSHYFGDGFARAFNMTYTDKENKQQYVHQTSWGTTTRLIGAIIMSHGDNNGLVLPPKLAPIQVAMVPIYKGEEQLKEMTEKMEAIAKELRAKGVSVKVDARDNVRSGFKFAEYELKGVPVRLAMGPRDMQNGTIEVARRDTLTKETVSQEGIAQYVANLLEEIQANIYKKALDYRNSMITEVNSWEEFVDVLENKGGFISAHWDGTVETEVAIKEATKATIRCIPLDAKPEEGKCVFSGKPSSCRVLFAKSY